MALLTPRRHVFITPYHLEERALIERCIASVEGQSVPADHILIADGHPQPWIGGDHLRHVQLDRGCDDYGNTPRGIAALLAISTEYDGIGFLDADNWLERDHLADCLGAAEQVQDCDYVIARRHLRRPDGSLIDAPDDPISVHVDMNCFYFLRGSFHLIPRLALIPRPLSILADRILYSLLREANLNSAVVASTTVNYRCRWESVYAAIGEVPPLGAKRGIDIDGHAAEQWLNQISAREVEITRRRSGLQLPIQLPQKAGPGFATSWSIRRNEACPCGSGIRYKRCHGRPGGAAG